MSESHEHSETSERDDDGKSRRGMLAILGLGVLGARALSGCAAPVARREDDEATGRGTQALFSAATMKVADTVGDLRGNSGSSTTIAVLLGYDAASTPGPAAGLFTWDASVTSTMDDGGTVFAVTSGGGWRRVFSGDLDVRWFGVRAGVGAASSNSAAIIVALKALPATGGVLHFPAGTYEVERNFLVSGPTNPAFEVSGKQHVKIRGDGRGATVIVDTRAPSALDSRGDYGIFSFFSMESPEVSCLTLDGGWRLGETRPTETSTRKGLFGRDCKNLVYRDLEVAGFVSESLYFDGTDPLTSGRIERNHVHNAAYPALNAGSPLAQSVFVTDNLCVDCGYSAISVAAQPRFRAAL